jgi:hypothetical protein
MVSILKKNIPHPLFFTIIHQEIFMMLGRNPLGFLLAVVLAAYSVHAQLPAIWSERGHSGYSFLKIKSNPRHVALGGGALAHVQYAGEAGQNALGYASHSQKSLSLDYGLLSQELGVQQNHFHASWGNAWGVDALILSIDTISGRDEYGAPTGAYGAGAFKVGLGTGGEWKQSANAPVYNRYGMQLSYGQMLIDNALSQAVIADLALGAQIHTLSLAIMLGNYGYATAFDKDQVQLPAYLQAGVGYDQPYKAFVFRPFLDIKRYSDEPFQVIGALETEYAQMLALRISAVLQQHSSVVWNGGAAVHVGSWALQYGYAGHARLSGSHQFGLEFVF